MATDNNKRKAEALATEESTRDNHRHPSTTKTKESALQCLPKEIWVAKIFPFLGPGHFAFVAGVCHNFKEYYLVYHPTLAALERKDTPPFGFTGTYRGVWKYVKNRLEPSVATDTFYAAASSSVACARYCIDGPQQSVHQEYICHSSARVGQLDVLKWARSAHLPPSMARLKF